MENFIFKEKIYLVQNILKSMRYDAYIFFSICLYLFLFNYVRLWACDDQGCVLQRCFSATFSLFACFCCHFLYATLFRFRGSQLIPFYIILRAVALVRYHGWPFGTGWHFESGCPPRYAKLLPRYVIFP